MDANQIRFAIFLAVFLLMLGLESIIQRHPTVDAKTRRLKINLALAGIDILVVRLFFGAAAVGAAQFAGERGWGLFNYLQWPEGLEIFLCVVFLDLMIYIQHVVVHMIPFLYRMMNTMHVRRNDHIS